MSIKRVLFVCVENSCRSQMAEGFARVLGKNILEAYSAGSKASGSVNPVAVKVMKEAGIDISRQRSKGFDDLQKKNFDYVITMGCGEVCPFFPAGQQIDWHIDDPRGKDIDAFRSTRDNIKEKVADFIKGAGYGKTF